jgi:predicted DNA-binding transcriptional regulator AlpA
LSVNQKSGIAKNMFVKNRGIQARLLFTAPAPSPTRDLEIAGRPNYLSAVHPRHGLTGAVSKTRPIETEDMSSTLSSRTTTKQPCTPPPAKAAYTIPDFCCLHSISRSLLYQLIANREGPRTFKVGARTLVSAEAAQEWVRAREQARLGMAP